MIGCWIYIEFSHCSSSSRNPLFTFSLILSCFYLYSISSWCIMDGSTCRFRDACIQSQHLTLKAEAPGILSSKPVLATQWQTVSLSCVQKILDKAQGLLYLFFLSGKGFYFSEIFTVCFSSPTSPFLQQRSGICQVISSWSSFCVFSHDTRSTSQY